MKGVEGIPFLVSTRGFSENVGETDASRIFPFLVLILRIFPRPSEIQTAAIALACQNIDEGRRVELG